MMAKKVIKLKRKKKEHLLFTRLCTDDCRIDSSLDAVLLLHFNTICSLFVLSEYLWASEALELVEALPIRLRRTERRLLLGTVGVCGASFKFKMALGSDSGLSSCCCGHNFPALGFSFSIVLETETFAIFNLHAARPASFFIFSSGVSWIVITDVSDKGSDLLTGEEDKVWLKATFAIWGGVFSICNSALRLSLPLIPTSGILPLAKSITGFLTAETERDMEDLAACDLVTRTQGEVFSSPAF